MFLKCLEFERKKAKGFIVLNKSVGSNMILESKMAFPCHYTCRAEIFSNSVYLSSLDILTQTIRVGLWDHGFSSVLLG